MSIKDTDVKTPGEATIAKKFKLSVKKVRQLVDVGAKHEKEHNTNLEKAKQVARDHIGERPDYYKMLKKAETTDKNHMKEEIGTAGIRGLGFVTGDPGVNAVDQYINTNAMAYDDWNGSILKMIRDKHSKHLKDMGFTSYSPNDMQNNTNKVVKENVLSELGDLDKSGSVGYEGLTDAAPISQKRRSVKEEKPCWKGYEAIGMKKKNGKKVPNCVPVKEQGYGIRSYTEKPLVEKKPTPDAMPTGADRGIYEGWASIGHPYDRFGDVNRKAKFYGKKPKATTTKSDEKDDTYKDSKQGGKVKLVKKNSENTVAEATYQGKTVPLNKPMKGDVKKSKVYVDPDGDGKAQKVNFGDKKLSIKKDQPDRKKSYCARSSGQGNLTDKTSANYWSRKAWNCEESVNEAKKPKPVNLTPKQEQDKTIPNSLASYREKIYQARLKQLRKEETQINELAADVAPMQHMDAAKSGEYRPARGSQSRVNLRGTTAHVKGAEYRSGTGSARASLGTGGQMKPTSTNVPTRFMRSVKNAPSTQGASGQMKPTSTSGSSSFTPNSQSRSMNVGKGMAASKQTSPVVKGMSAAGQEASKKIVPKAAGIAATVGKAARALSGPEGAAVTAAAEPLAKKMAASHKAGHQSFASHGSEGEKTSTVFARMKQPSQGRSVSQYEKDVLTPKASEAPKAPETPKVDAPTPPSRPDYFSRGQAFSAARKEAGGGEGKFSYQGGSDSAPKTYQTNVSGEKYKPETQLKQTNVKEETKMDKDLINEALQNILSDNLSEMKENLTQALQEKAMEKLEERKKEIAANYFAQ